MDCQQTIITVPQKVSRADIAISSDTFAVYDPPKMRGHWDLGTCSLATAIDIRMLVFSRSIQYAKIPCCNLVIPLGWGADFVLIDYLPVIGHEQLSNFSKRRKHEVIAVTPPKYDLSIYEQNFGVLIVDVRQGRTLISGEISSVEDFTMGQLTLTIDASAPSGANYIAFLNQQEDEIVTYSPVAVMQTIEPNYQEYTDIETSDGFIRVL